jgi:tRNA (adenine57-N1/adenine58-N1)-methyltransferase
MKKIRRGQKVLLLGREKSFLVKAKGEFHCEYGIVDLERVVRREFGCKVKSHLGEEFSVVEPAIIDFLKKAKRLPQVILPRDSCLILAKTGVNKNSIAIDAGTGSAFLAIFLANYLKRVYTYEKRKEFYEVAKENIKESGLRNIEIKNKDVSKGFDEKNVDLVVLDLEKPEKIVRHAFRALKRGGWLVAFCPFAEEVSKVVKEIEKYEFCSLEIIEPLQREWQLSFDKKGESHLRAKPYVTFTGFLVFARKL